MLENVLIVISVSFCLSLLFSRRIRRARFWRATVTPLASIIGSGFLIIAPLLSMTVGKYAPFAILALVLCAYFVGNAIRFNIQNLEPLMDERHSLKFLWHLEEISTITLGVAYFISVAFYLQLLSSFLMKGIGLEGTTTHKCITTAILASIGILGRWKGLHLLESLEEYSVSIKLSIIAGLLAGLIWLNSDLISSHNWILQASSPTLTLNRVRKLMGMLIVVQGFETSRYLGNEYDSKMRTRSMRTAQIISGLIYIVFVSLILILLGKTPDTSETAIVDLSAKITPLLPALLIVAALMSQFSAAVADTIGSGGLISGSLKGRLSERNIYLIVASLGILLIWTSNIFDVINLASRAFALYYAIQSLEAGLLASGIFHSQKSTTPKRQLGRTSFYLLLFLLLFCITLFGVPAE